MVATQALTTIRFGLKPDHNPVTQPRPPVKPLSPVGPGEFPQNPARPFGGFEVRGGANAPPARCGKCPTCQVRQMPHLAQVARRYKPQQGAGWFFLVSQTADVGRKCDRFSGEEGGERSAVPTVPFGAVGRPGEPLSSPQQTPTAALRSSQSYRKHSPTPKTSTRQRQHAATHMRSTRRDQKRSTPPSHRNHLALRTFNPKTNPKPTNFGHTSCTKGRKTITARGRELRP